MIDAGYFAKRVVPGSGWLNAPGVAEICSVSTCIASGPEGWIDRWLHNELGWFNSALDAMAVVPADERIVYRLFAYRIHPHLFRDGSAQPFALPPDVRAVAIPATFQSLGFDAVSKSLPGLGFECSPLSCNGMAAEMATNESCLFDSLDGAIAGAARFSIEQPEPGDYYVVEVLEEQ